MENKNKKTETRQYDSKIVNISKIATLIFIALVVCADVFGVIISRYACYVIAGNFEDWAFGLTTTVFYLATIAAYAVLFSVYRLLGNIQKDVVFDKKNTDLMGWIVRALLVIAILCCVSALAVRMTVWLAVVAVFMALIVLTVKVVFDKAIDMKNEMDLTI